MVENVRNPELNEPTSRFLADRVGMVASAACAVHCVVCAVVPSILAALGLGVLIGHEAEWLFTGVAAVFALGALVTGLRSHGARLPAVVLGLGVVSLILSRLFEEWHLGSLGMAFSVMAGITLVVGHITNLRASRRCCEAAACQEDA